MHKLPAFLGILLLGWAGMAPAQTGVPITFLPPPMEGRLSLGIFSEKGKLVRVLRTEASVEKDFTVGLNGLITSWDGNDEAGRTAPAGKYRLRGYAVGKLEVSGEAFHGNDWIVDDQSARVAEVQSLKALEGRRLQIRARLVDGSTVALQSDAEGRVTRHADDDPSTPESGGGVEAILSKLGGPLPELEKPLDACFGVGESVWVIDQTTAGVEVKQYSAKKEFLRRLAITPGEPAPRQIAAAQGEECLYLLESGPSGQRVRGLALETAAAPAEPGGTAQSTWQTFFSKSITVHQSFAAFAPTLERPEFKAEEKLHLKLVPNSLEKDLPGTVDLQIAIDAKGSFLRTADGLPLLRLTDTPGLRWAVLGREGKAKRITFFQSDGAVVEEFKIKQTANMMAFDAGEYEWRR